jgi:hypothetical protein
MLQFAWTWEDTALLESNRSAQVRPSIGQRRRLAFSALCFCPIDMAFSRKRGGREEQLESLLEMAFKGATTGSGIGKASLFEQA